MAEQILTVGEIFARLGDVLRENIGPLAGCVVGLTAVNVALDSISTGTGTTLPAGIASLAAQYYLTASSLERLGLREPGGRNRFGAFWGLNILSGLGILLGYIVLILPGLYLSARWVAASAALLTEDEGVNNAMGRSWEITQPSVWPIIGALLVIFVPACLAGFGLAFLFQAWLPVVGSVLMYVFITSALTISWLAGVAIYSLLKPGVSQLAEVFA